MTTAISKAQSAAAALALACAVTLTPVVAQADLIAPAAPSLGFLPAALGSAAGDPVGVACSDPELGDCVLVSAAQANANNSATEPGIGSWFLPLIQNQLWWFGTPNPTPPDQIATFTPLQLLPQFLQDIIGGFFGLFDFEACIFGISTSLGQTTPEVGPYGNLQIGVSQGCA